MQSRSVYHGLLKRFIGSSMCMLCALLLPERASAEDVFAIGEPAHSFTSALLPKSITLASVASSSTLPGREVLSELIAADAVIMNGGDREPWIALTGISRRRLFSLQQALEKNQIIAGEEVTHSHGPGGEHTHGGVNAHFYLLPELMLDIAGYLKAGLGKRLKIDINDASLKKQIASLDKTLEELSPVLKRKVVFAGDAFDYLDSHYGWKGIHSSIHYDALPEAWQEGELRGLLTGQQRKYILFPAMPIPALEKRLQEEFNLQTLVLPDCVQHSCQNFFQSYENALMKMKQTLFDSAS